MLDAGFTLTFCDGESIATAAVASGVHVTAQAVEAAEPAVRREIGRYVWAATVKQESEPARKGGPPFFRRLLELAGAPDPSAQLDAAATAIWDAHLKRNVWRRVGLGVDAALERLRDAGMKLAVVSNSEGTIQRMLNDSGLARHFDAVIDSWVVGVAKPDPRIFHLALECLGVDAADAIMIGDMPLLDVAGAQAAGIRAVLLDPLDLHPAAEVPRFTDVPAFVSALLDRR